MNPYTAEDAAWASRRMRDHVSYAGWLSAMGIGTALWSVMIALAI